MNYIQGASPVLMADGSVVLFADWGKCCYHPSDPEFGGGEHIGGIVYENNSVATKVIVRSGDMPDGHEAAFPAPVFYEGKWYIAFASTKASTIGETYRVGIGIVIADKDLNLESYNQDWVRIEETSLFPIGWVTDGYVPVLYAAEFASGKLYIISITGQVTKTDQIIGDFTDIGKGKDGFFYALSGVSHEGKEIVEWIGSEPSKYCVDVKAKTCKPWIPGACQDGTIESTYCPYGRQIIWVKSGRTFSVENGSLFDAAYLKDEYGMIVEPRVIVANTSDGLWVTENNWNLSYYAEQGAVLPEAWGKTIEPTPTPTPSPRPPRRKINVIRGCMYIVGDQQPVRINPQGRANVIVNSESGGGVVVYGSAWCALYETNGYVPPLYPQAANEDLVMWQISPNTNFSLNVWCK